MKAVVLGCALLLCLSTPVQAYHGEAALDVARSAGSDFAAQRAAIARDLADGETYAELSAAARAEVVASLDAMQALLGQSGSVDAMPPQLRVELFNAQEKVNTLLTQAAEDSRRVCTRERRVGSNFVVSSCQTVAERRRQQEAGADALRQGSLTPASVLGD
ncbi:hypothetical protein [Marilutibacter spongiae]|uniref:Lysozyme inhibitor LprI N-terminal domain-containing protein n=1 Tax=Marilutibacter spongiae TaxID=2025720 RepID=A0A7W3Y551_9GAMM|nr:hypothetical protein [Lysobacter spongiae]MBB1060133.1 hypothetical protein [Lysobacter spongiae]